MGESERFDAIARELDARGLTLFTARRDDLWLAFVWDRSRPDRDMGGHTPVCAGASALQAATRLRAVLTDAA